MSQEKVELKKAEKRNMKKTVKKRKLGAVLGVIVVVCIAGGLVAWFVMSADQKIKENTVAEPETVQVDLSALSGFNATVDAAAKDVTAEDDTENNAETDAE